MGDSPGTSIRHVLVGAAFLFQTCQLVLRTLAAGPRPLSQLLVAVVAAVAMAVILMGGVIYLAHAALTAPRWRIALGITWVLVLSAPAGMEMHDAVSYPGLRLAWALLPGLTATGCVLAAVASSRLQPPGSGSGPVFCQGCGRAFASKQGRGGHQRSCPARLALPASR